MKERSVSLCAFAERLKNKNYIILQNRHGLSRYGEEWSLFGGGIKPGETHFEAMIRELQEEIPGIGDIVCAYLGEISHVTPKETKIHHLYRSPFPEIFVPRAQQFRPENYCAVGEGAWSLFNMKKEKKELLLPPGQEELLRRVDAYLNNQL